MTWQVAPTLLSKQKQKMTGINRWQRYSAEEALASSELKCLRQNVPKQKHANKYCKFLLLQFVLLQVL